MDSLIAFYQKNMAASVMAMLLLPIAGALIYGSLKSFWQKKKAKQHSIAIYEYLVASAGNPNAATTDEIAKALSIPRNDVIELCSNHPQIVDAGKRQRSWKLKAAEEDAAEAEQQRKKKN
ncbi:MAG: hypothetical protein H6R04_66 [Burkholderiaceae bacterium]|nr:hypothetical protein [Burkholderiaceae bacterium]